MGRIFFDAEFDEDGITIEPISIGMVRDEDGATFEAVFRFDESRVNPWVRENVLPHLAGKDRFDKHDVAVAIVDFVGPDPEFWADWAAYDWVLICQLYGTMLDLPAGWPMWCRDIRHLWDELGRPDLPPQGGREHVALELARHVRTCYHFLRDLQDHRRRHLVQFMDPDYRRALATDVGPVVLARLAFGHRFGRLGAADALGPDAGPVVLRVPGQGVAILDAVAEVRFVGVAGPEIELPRRRRLGFHITVPLDELTGWNDDRLVDEAVEQLVAGVADVICALADTVHSTDLDSALAALAGHAPEPHVPQLWALGDEARVKELAGRPTISAFDGGPGWPSRAGELVLLRPDALVLAYYGLMVSEWLDEDGWHLAGEAPLSAALMVGAARRID